MPFLTPPRFLGLGGVAVLARVVAHVRADPTRAGAGGDARCPRRRHHLPRRRPLQRRDGRALPFPTGYSEVVFGELFRAAGWVRDEVVVANKLWWEFWPEQDAVGRARRLARADGPRPHRPDLHDAAARRPADRRAGRAGGGAGVVGAGARVGHRQLAGRAELAEAVAGCPFARGARYPSPPSCRTAWYAPTGCRTRRWRAVLVDADIGLVASYVLAGGTLTGKYLDGELRSRRRRRATRPSSPETSVPRSLVELAGEWNVTPASLAFSFALSHPRLASVLFGATSPEQLRENVASLEVFMRLDDARTRAARPTRRVLARRGRRVLVRWCNGRRRRIGVY